MFINLLNKIILKRDINIHSPPAPILFDFTVQDSAQRIRFQSSVLHLARRSAQSDKISKFKNEPKSKMNRNDYMKSGYNVDMVYRKCSNFNRLLREDKQWT